MSFCARGKFWEKEPHTHSPPTPLSVVGVSNTMNEELDQIEKNNTWEYSLDETTLLGCTFFVN